MIAVPETHPDLAFVLSAMAGHLFGYEAALAIDGLALPLREARAAIEGLIAGGDLGTGPAPDGLAARPAGPTTRWCCRSTARRCCAGCAPTS